MTRIIAIVMKSETLDFPGSISGQRNRRADLRQFRRLLEDLGHQAPLAKRQAQNEPANAPPTIAMCIGPPCMDQTFPSRLWIGSAHHSAMRRCLKLFR